MEKRVPEVGDRVEVGGEIGVVRRRILSVLYSIEYEGNKLGFADPEGLKLLDAPDSRPLHYLEQLKASLTCLADALESVAELGNAERGTWAKQIRVVVNELNGPLW